MIIPAFVAVISIPSVVSAAVGPLMIVVPADMVVAVGKVMIMIIIVLLLLQAITWLPPRDLSAYFPDLAHIVDAIRRLRVLWLDVKVEVSTERRRCEGMMTEWALLVLERFGLLSPVIAYSTPGLGSRPVACIGLTVCHCRCADTDCEQPGKYSCMRKVRF